MWLASRKWQVVGVDFSPDGLGKGQRMADAPGVDVKWVEADLVSGIPPCNAIDLVVAMHLQVPIDQRRAALVHAAAPLGPGGVLLVVGHDATNPVESLHIERTERVRRSPSMPGSAPSGPPDGPVGGDWVRPQPRGATASPTAVSRSAASAASSASSGPGISIRGSAIDARVPSRLASRTTSQGSSRLADGSSSSAR